MQKRINRRDIMWVVTLGINVPFYCAVDGEHMLSCIETADLIEIPVGVWSWMRSKNHVWWGLARTAMWPLVKIFDCFITF